MKAIAAYIQPFMLEKVADALRIHNIHGVTVLQGEGFGKRMEGNTPHYEDPSVDLGYAPKVKIEILCRDDEAKRIVQVIRESAHTGHHGDGKIFVTDVSHVVDIRTGAEGETIL